MFSVHLHSFLYLVTLLTTVAEWLLPFSLGALLLGWVLLYLPLALRRAYGSGWGGALSKSVFIVLADALLLAVGFTGAALVALALM